MNVAQILEEVAVIANDEALVLPIATGTALKVQRTTDDPDATVDEMARLIMAEPMLSAQAVAIANSAAYRRTGREVQDARSATSRIGFKTVRSLATSAVVRQMKELAPTPEIRQKTIRLWEHVAHVAALAQIVARHITRVDPEVAIFMGILHESAGFFLISLGEAYPGLLKAGELEAWTGEAEARIGRAILRKIDVSAEVIRAMEGVWAGEFHPPPRSFADTLLLAHALSPVESPLRRFAGAPAVQAYLDTTVDAKTRNRILEEAMPETLSLISAIL